MHFRWNCRSAISAADLPRKFEAITKDNKLMIDQGGKVQMETLIVLLGLEPLENYTDNLHKKCRAYQKKSSNRCRT